jgi:hypothetical protein
MCIASSASRTRNRRWVELGAACMVPGLRGRATRARARATEMFLTHHPHIRVTPTPPTLRLLNPLSNTPTPSLTIQLLGHTPIVPHCGAGAGSTTAPPERHNTHHSGDDTRMFTTSWHSSAVVYQVGDFRWRPPRDALPFDKGWMKATEWPDSCPNLLRSPSPLCRTCSTRSNPPIEPNSEDCLKLNVFAPDGSTGE